MTQHEGGAPTRALPSVRLTPGFWVKLALLALLDALVIWAIPTMVAEDLWPLLVLMVLGAIFINWAYISPASPGDEVVGPGLWLMGTFTVFPILYTVYVSLTNWQTGNYLNKSQAIERIEAIPATGEVGAVPATLSVYEDAEGNIRFWVGDRGRRSVLRRARDHATPSRAMLLSRTRRSTASMRLRDRQNRLALTHSSHRSSCSPEPRNCRGWCSTSPIAEWWRR